MIGVAISGDAVPYPLYPKLEVLALRLPPAGVQYLWQLVRMAPWLLRSIKRLFPSFGTGVYVPSSLLRYFTFKILVDLQQIPALNELTLAGVRCALCPTNLGVKSIDSRVHVVVKVLGL